MFHLYIHLWVIGGGHPLLDSKLLANSLNKPCCVLGALVRDDISGKIAVLPDIVQEKGCYVFSSAFCHCGHEVHLLCQVVSHYQDCVMLVTAQKLGDEVCGHSLPRLFRYFVWLQQPLWHLGLFLCPLETIAQVNIFFCG